MTRIVGFVTFLALAVSAYAVPPVLNYAGQVAVNGEAFDGNGLFKFALVNADGTTTYWSNDGTSVDGSEPQASVTVPVNGGLYAVLLGNTAQQGMGAIDPALFAQHTDAKLRVWFSDGVNGFQQLSPDRPFASVPYAFSAGTAQTAGSASITTGAVNLDMLSEEVKTQINAPISRSRLSQEVVADINATIGMNRLSTEVTEKLNQEKTTTNYNAPSVGSLLAVPYGTDAPSGYSLYQRGEPKELVWEEKAPVSVARWAYDGVVELGGKIFLVGGGKANSSYNIVESYNPETNQWEILSAMSYARKCVASTVLNGKLYAIGGQGLSSVEIYDPLTNTWATGSALPSEVANGAAITVGGKIYLIGGRNSSNQKISQVLCFDPSSDQWNTMANMPTAREGLKLAFYDSRIWALGGQNTSKLNKVESYDPSTNSWKTEASLHITRYMPVSWISNGDLYLGGGYNGSFRSSIEVYDSVSKVWRYKGNLAEKNEGGDSVVVDGTLYLIGGKTSNPSSFSNKVYAADLNASVEGIYDLYRKDGDAPVGTPVVQSEYADGSVTTAKLDATILKYLKPEITTQPQAQTVYADNNVSFSVTAEGKYLTYQWKKDGDDLAGENNASLNITDANATLHDGNYTVVVSNDFGSVETGSVSVQVSDALLNGLVGWWKFDEGSGTVAYDSSGNGNDGNLTNGPTWTTGKIGGALNFDGTNDYVKIGASSVFDLQRISISAWVKSENYSSSGFIFEKTTDGSVNSQYALFFENGLRFRNEGGGDDVSFSVSSVGWLFVTSTYDGSRKKLFTNGLERNQVTWTGTIPTSPSGVSAIGGFSQTSHESWSNYIFNGLIDDVRIYDRALSAEEVQALYNLGQ
jgi:N-acetylneuraminic acid mutarotase